MVAPARPRTDTKRKRQPNYAVVIENDDQHTFDYVIDVLQRICGHGPQKAYELTLEAHSRGRAVVWTGAREVAELKCEQIRGFGPDGYAQRPVAFPLGTYIEPLPVD
jgi:ATP-dependent Clp protease adaptor protein ClpS